MNPKKSPIPRCRPLLALLLTAAAPITGLAEAHAPGTGSPPLGQPGHVNDGDGSRGGPGQPGPKGRAGGAGGASRQSNRDPGTDAGAGVPKRTAPPL
jgi:hypothetical protein